MLQLVAITLVFGQAGPTEPREDDVPYRTTAVDFLAITKADQTALVLSAFEDRMEFTSNLFYEFTCHYYNCSRVDDNPSAEDYTVGDCKIGPVVWKGRRRRLKHWRIADSYRIDISSHRSPGDPDFSSIIRNSFSENTGVARGTFERPDGSATPTGRIDTTHDTFMDFNRYIRWLSGPKREVGDYFLTYFIQNSDRYQIYADPEEPHLICVTVPWTAGKTNDEPIGRRTLWLDPQKGLLPVKCDSWRQHEHNFWRRETFTVEESRVVGGFHLPTRLRETLAVRHPTPRDPVITIYETIVEKIEQGTVTEADLELEFPPGTEVVDAIEGKSYIVGANGEETRQAPLLVGTQLTGDGPKIAGLTPVPGPSPRTIPWTWIAAVLFAIGLIGFTVYRKRQTA